MFKFQEENLIFCYHLSFLALVCLIICNNLHLFLTVHCETIFKFHYWEKNINDIINILSVKTPFFFFLLSIYTGETIKYIKDIKDGRELFCQIAKTVIAMYMISYALKGALPKP